jgi:hypothetical protein
MLVPPIVAEQVKLCRRSHTKAVFSEFDQEFVMTLFAQRAAKRTKISWSFYRRTPGGVVATEGVQRINGALTYAAVDAVGFAEILRSFKSF